MALGPPRRWPRPPRRTPSGSPATPTADGVPGARPPGPADRREPGRALVVGDLARIDDVRRLADQAREHGRIDAWVHNPGVWVRGSTPRTSADGQRQVPTQAGRPRRPRATSDRPRTPPPSAARHPTWPRRPTGRTQRRHRSPDRCGTALQDAIFAARDRVVGVG